MDPAFLVSPNTAKNFSGTSASAPVVSGVAALILAAAPSLTPAQVESTLLSTAQPGVGVASSTIDAEAALFSALVPFLPPDMRIQQPTNGSVFYIYRNPRFGWSGDTIDLRGTSIRANSLTSPLPDVQVDWTATGANGVKALGKGHANSVNALDLGEGIHTITFRGTDPPLVGTESVTIEVRLWRPIVCDPICS